VELTSTSDDVFTGFRNPCLHARIGLGETLETFDEFGEISSVLDLDGDLHDRGDGEPHDFHVVGSFGGCKGTALQQELINTNETNDVTGRAILNGFNVTSHHEHGTLDRLDEKIILLSREVVGTLDTDLGSRHDSSGEDTTEGVEASLIGCGHHLGDVKDQRTLRVTVADTDGRLIVHGTLVEGLNTVALSGSGRRKVDDYHLQEGVSSRQKLAHDDFEECLALEITLVLSKFNLKLIEHGTDGVLLEVHNGIENPEDGLENEAVEGTLKGLSVSADVGGSPFAGGRVEVVVTPKLEHHLVLVYTELLGITGGELTESETPSVETRSEGDGSLVGVDLHITKSSIVVGGDDDVNALDGTLERLVEGFLVDLKFEKGAIDLVDDDNRLDTLSKGLSQHGFCLHADTLDAIDDNKGTISYTESSSDFRGKINVSGGVDQIDQEFVS
jgi:hypothetical protein